MKKALFVALTMLIVTTAAAGFAADDSARLDMLEQKINALETKKGTSSAPEWLTIGGEYRFRYDILSGNVHDYMQYDPAANFGPMPSAMPGINMFTYSSPTPGYTTRNDSLMLTRFGLHLKARATEDIQVKAKLDMYKVFGGSTSDAVTNPFYSPEKSGVFDGNSAHVPEDNALRVDYAYATWSNVGGAPVWFSVGRRPSTGGIPSNLRQNTEKVGTAGVPAFLIDYAFDGMTIGIAPEISALPGAFAKLCYGRGNDSGYQPSGANGLKDTDMVGVNVVPYDTEAFHAELQWNRAIRMMSNPPVEAFGEVQANMGDISQFGAILSGRIEHAGPGSLNWFVSGAVSRTDPSGNTFDMPFGWMDMDADGVFTPGVDVVFNSSFGLLSDGSSMEKHGGASFYLGGRYDISGTRTKIGAEYNRGSKYWIAFTPASDDLIASKLGTRGDVYEVYVIQEIPQAAISKHGKAFFRLGYQRYNFDYTGSNSWLGAPQKIAGLNTANPMATQMYAPLSSAKDVYATFDVQF